MNDYWVYITSSYRGTLYTGVTNDLERRIHEYRDKLVYYEGTDDVESAIAREKQIKGWLRSKKVALIEKLNRRWRDLAEEWSEGTQPPQTLRFAQGDN